MLDSKVVEIARTMIQVQFDERRDQLRRNILQIKGEMAKRGMSNSTTTLSLLCDLYADEIKTWADIVWEELKKILSSVDAHPSEELASDLKGEVAKYLFATLSEFNEALHKSANHIGNVVIAKQLDIFLNNLDNAYGNTLKRVNAKIDLFILSLNQDKEKETRVDSNRNVINITGNVGAVQTGQGAIANVNQIISSHDQEALLQALDDIKKYLESGGNLSGFSKEEVLELVEESRVEVEKHNPNSSRLKTYLIGIAISIQTAAGLKPAYEVIKFALSHFHIILP